MCAAQDGLVADDRLLAVAQELATRASCASSLFVSAGKQVAWAWLGFRTRPDEATIAALLNTRRTDGVSIAVGEPAPGVAGFRNGHAEPLAARRLARLSKHRAGSVTRWGSVAVLGQLSADVERAREFVSRELGPLDADDDAMARLRATLACTSARAT